MKNLFHLTVFLSLFFCLTASASMEPDSVGLKKSEGKTYIIHRIETAEGWFSIARMYGVSYAELRMANKDSADKLIPGRTILIPADKLKSTDAHFGKNYIQQKEIFYQVKEGETLFSIAKRFTTNVDSLKKWNHLNGALKKGQRLIVGYGSTTEAQKVFADEGKTKKKQEDNSDSVSGIKKVTVPLDHKNVVTVGKQDSSKQSHKDGTPVPVKPARPSAPDSTKMIKTASSLKYNETKKSGVAHAKGRKELNENGVASWIRDDDINPNKYYALHRSAPIGTIIKVSNKMNNKYVFVKVVGTLPDTGDNTDLIIKISKASAEKLGVRDSKFQCELNYGVNEKP
jgi:LysM repeat protein